MFHPLNKFKRERSLRTQAMPPPVPPKKAATGLGGGLMMPEIPMPSHSTGGGSDDGDSSEQGTGGSAPAAHLSPRWGQPKPGDPLGEAPALFWACGRPSFLAIPPASHPCQTSGAATYVPLGLFSIGH